MELVELLDKIEAKQERASRAEIKQLVNLARRWIGERQTISACAQTLADHLGDEYLSPFFDDKGPGTNVAQSLDTVRLTLEQMRDARWDDDVEA